MEKTKKISTAMILAAGFGTRMKELTRNLPKPLLPVGDHTLLDLLLIKLQREGIRKVVINLHYQAEKIRQHLSVHRPPDMQIEFSPEAEILGTGGGIARAEQFFNDEDILVMNSDVLSDLSLTDFQTFFYHRSALACMAVLPSRDNRNYSLVLYDNEGRIHGFLRKGETPPPGLHSGIFTGYQILSPAARRYLQPVFSSVIDAFYRPAIRNGETVCAYLHTGKWIDLGTREHYLKLMNDLNTGMYHIRDFI